MLERCLVCILFVSLAGCAGEANDWTSEMPKVESMSPSAWMSASDYGASSRVPPLEGSRKVNEQSCTTGVDLLAGNLKCK